MAVLSSRHEASLIDIEAGQVVWKVPLEASLHGLTTDLAWASDSRRLMICEKAHASRIWDVQLRRPVLTLSAAGASWCACWSPDGEKIAQGRENGLIQISDSATGEIVTTLRGHRGWARDIAWSPDGRRLASGGADRTVRVWDALSGEEILRLPEGDDIVIRVAWSPDGKKLACVEQKGAVRIWDATAGYEEADRRSIPWWVAGPFPESPAEAVPPASGRLPWRRLHTGFDTQVDFGALFPNAEPGRVYAMTFVHSPVAQKADLMLGHTGGLSVWLNKELVYQHDLTRPGVDAVAAPVALRAGWNPVLVRATSLVQRLDRFSLRVTTAAGVSLAHTPGTEYVPEPGEPTPGEGPFRSGELAVVQFVLRLNGRVEINGRRVGSGDELVPPPEAGAGPGAWLDVTAVDWSRGAHVSATVLARLEGLRSLRSLDLSRSAVRDAGLEAVARLGTLEALDVSDTAVTGAGLKHLARLESLKTLTVDNVDVTPADLTELKAHRPGLAVRGVPAWGLTPTEAKKLEGPTAGIFGVVFAPDGKSVVSICDDWMLRVHDVQTGKETLAVRAVGGLRGLALTSDGRQAVVAGHANAVQLRDLASGKLLREYEGVTKPSAAALSPDDRFVCACEGTRCVLWDRETGDTVNRFDFPAGELHSVAFSPDGHTLAVAGAKLVWLWDMKTGKVRKQLTGHTDAVTRVAFTPDGRHLVSASRDQTLRLWAVPGGREVRRFEGHGAEVCSVAVSPDGEHLLSGSMDRTLRLWELRTGRKVAVAKADTPLTNYVAFSPDGRGAVSGGGWDMQPGKGFVRYDDVALRLWQFPDLPPPRSPERK